MTQKTRLELENEQVSQEELEESIQVGSVFSYDPAKTSLILFLLSISWSPFYSIFEMLHRLTDLLLIDLNACMVAQTASCGNVGSGCDQLREIARRDRFHGVNRSIYCHINTAGVTSVFLLNNNGSCRKELVNSAHCHTVEEQHKKCVMIHAWSIPSYRSNTRSYS